MDFIPQHFIDNLGYMGKGMAGHFCRHRRYHNRHYNCQQNMLILSSQAGR